MTGTLVQAPTMSAPSISVVVCTYTEARRTDLIAAVDSLRVQATPAAEVIVVVDHNPALLHDLEGALSGVVVAPNHEAQGLSGGRNTGAALARGEVVAFLDDDAAAAPDWLQRLGEGYSDGRVLGVGGAIVPIWLGGRPAWFPEEFDWVVGCSYRGMPREAAPVRNLIGANMSFRRAALDQAGGFRRELGRIGTRPLGCEETELCIRIRQRTPEAQLLHAPDAIVYHRVPAERGTWRYFRSRCFGEGLSKAHVARLVGRSDALAAEHRYTRSVLPRGAARACGRFLLRRDAAELGRALAITAGLGCTAAGFALGTIGRRSRSATGARAA